MKWKTFFAILLVLVVVVGFIVWQVYRVPPGPAQDLNHLEPVILLSITPSLGSFLIGTPAQASRTIEAFANHTISTKPRLSYVFASYSCDIRSRDRDGIFILKDKVTGALLLEDGTWPASPSLDAPHWRSPGRPRLEFPTPAVGGQQ